MESNLLTVRNMVCRSCIKVVTQDLQEIGTPYDKVILGEIKLKRPLTDQELSRLKSKIAEDGFQIIDNKRQKTVEMIKLIIRDIVQNHEKNNLREFTKIIAKKLGSEYANLSTLFSHEEKVTIERYLILTKLEKVKELLLYNEITLSEIADKLAYSNVHHLSSQFKKIVGLTPREFKKQIQTGRKSLDKV